MTSAISAIFTSKIYGNAEIQTRGSWIWKQLCELLCYETPFEECLLRNFYSIFQKQAEGEACCWHPIQRSRVRGHRPIQLRRHGRGVCRQAQVQAFRLKRNLVPRRKPGRRRLRVTRASELLPHLQVPKELFT